MLSVSRRVTKQRLFIPDLLLLDKIPTSGAKQNTRLTSVTWFTLLFGHEANILSSYGLEASVLVLPGLETKVLTGASVQRPNNWPWPRNTRICLQVP